MDTNKDLQDMKQMLSLLNVLVQRQEEDLKKTREEQVRNISDIEQINIHMDSLRNRVSSLEQRFK